MSYNNTKLLAAILGYSLLACSICGCTANTSTQTTEATESSETSEYAVTYLDSNDMFTDRDKEVGYDEETAVSVTLADGATSCDDNSVSIEDDTVTISEEGTYILSGSLSNGQIITSGTYTITAAKHALSGKDSVRIADGATISGGTIVAVGASGMAQNFGSDSTQGSILVTVADSTLTGDLTLTDSDGNVVIAYSPEKAYNSVVISCPDLKEGETYTLKTGDVTNTVTMSSLIYGEDDQMRR